MSMSPEEEKQFQEYVNFHREHTAKQMASSAFVTSIVPSGETDIKFAMELGLSIMLDKPILALVRPGAPVPPKLRKVADQIVEIGMDDLETPSTQEKMVAILKEFTEKHVGND